MWRKEREERRKVIGFHIVQVDEEIFQLTQSLVLVRSLSLVNISVYSFTAHLCHILKIKLISMY